MTTARPTFDGAPYDIDAKKQLRRTAEALALVMAGKINCVVDVTLTANAASTTLKDPRIGYFSAILLMPMTANAAAALATTYVLQTGMLKGSAVISHANDTHADKTFRAVILG
jgi:hypothetical protein